MTAIVADIRNKLNGSVFSKNRYGAYVRTKVTPVNPQSTAQQTQRNLLSANSQAWRGLTEAQRNAWIAAAPSFPFTDIFGNSKILSGNALYVKVNNNLGTIGQAVIANPPAPVAIPAMVVGVFTAVSSTGVVSLSFDPDPIPANFHIVIRTTGNTTPGKSFVKNMFRTITTMAPGTVSPKLLTATFAAKFGAPVIGQKIFVQAYLVSALSGQAGIAAQTMAIVS